VLEKDKGTPVGSLTKFLWTETEYQLYGSGERYEIGKLKPLLHFLAIKRALYFTLIDLERGLKRL
jgi:hypothetical protein